MMLGQRLEFLLSHCKFLYLIADVAEACDSLHMIYRAMYLEADSALSLIMSLMIPDRYVSDLKAQMEKMI